MVRGFFEPWIDPFREISRLHQEMSRLLDEPWFGSRWRASVYPPVNVWSTGEDVVVSAELPGMKSEDINVSITGSTLTLSGERKADDVEGASYRRQERRTGSFARTLELPVEVDPTKAEADYVNGVLTVRIPKAPEHKPKQITIKAT